MTTIQELSGWECSDGKRFDSKTLATEHQRKLDDAKLANVKINEIRTEITKLYGLPTEHNMFLSPMGFEFYLECTLRYRTKIVKILTDNETVLNQKYPVKQATVLHEKSS